MCYQETTASAVMGWAARTNDLRFAAASLDPAAAEEAVVVVADGGLAGGDAVAGLVEADAKTAFGQGFDRGLRGRAAVTDLYLAEGRFTRQVDQPVGLVGR